MHEAVAALDMGKGASLASIKKYLTVQYNLDGTSHHLAAALKKAETAKTMVKVKASYKMVTAAKPPAKAKPASKAKPVAKPAASKKPTAIAKPTAKSAAKATAAPRAEEEETDEEMAIGKDVDDAPLAVGESCVVMGDSGEYYEVTRDTATVWHCQVRAPACAHIHLTLSSPHAHSTLCPRPSPPLSRAVQGLQVHEKGQAPSVWPQDLQAHRGHQIWRIQARGDQVGSPAKAQAGRRRLVSQGD